MVLRGHFTTGAQVMVSLPTKRICFPHMVKMESKLGCELFPTLPNVT